MCACARRSTECAAKVSEDTGRRGNRVNVNPHGGMMDDERLKPGATSEDHFFVWGERRREKERTDRAHPSSHKQRGVRA